MAKHAGKKAYDISNMGYGEKSDSNFSIPPRFGPNTVEAQHECLVQKRQSRKKNYWGQG